MSRASAVRARPHVAPSMVESIFSGVFEQGVGNQTFKIVNIILVALFGSIGFMFLNGLGSVHVYVLMFLAAGLAISLNWFRSELIANKPTNDEPTDQSTVNNDQSTTSEQSIKPSRPSTRQSNQKSLDVPADDSDDEEFRPRRPVTRSQSRGREAASTQSTNQSTAQSETSAKKTRRSRKE